MQNYLVQNQSGLFGALRGNQKSQDLIGIASGTSAGSSSLPIFGNTANGITPQTLTAFRAGSYFVAPATGNYTTFHVYCQGSVGITQFIGVYAVSAGSVNGQSLIAQGTISAPTGTPGWTTGSISVPVVGGQTYFLVASNGNGTSPFNCYVSSTTGAVSAFVSGSGSLPATASGYTNQTQNYCMYLSKP